MPPRPPLSPPPPTGYVFVISGTRCAAGSVSCWRYSHVIHVKLIHDSWYSTCQSQKRTAIAAAAEAITTTTRTLVVEEKLPGKCHAHNLLKDSLENVGQTTSAGEIYLHLSLSWKIAKLNCQTVQSMGSWEIGGKFASKFEKVRAIDEEESFIIPLQLARQAQRTSALDN